MTATYLDDASAADDGSQSPPLLDGIGSLTSHWLEQALRAGSGIETTISSFEAVEIGTGQMAAAYRVRFLGGGRSTDAPDSVVVKLSAGDEQTRLASVGGFVAEVAFYRSIGPRLDARVPRCWYADISEDGSRFVLVLEDLSALDPGQQIRGCSVDEAKTALSNLALAHASFWDTPALAEALSFRPTPPDPQAAAHGLGGYLVQSTETFIGTYDDALSDQDKATLRSAAEVSGRWLAEETGPLTLVHGDYRLDNLMFSEAGEVVTLDWQTYSDGNGGRDVAYFVACSFPAETRADVEWDLVGHYHSALTAAGVEGYSFEACSADYRRGVLQGPLITVLGAMAAAVGRSETGDAMFVSMAERSARAVRELGAVELFGADAR